VAQDAADAGHPSMWAQNPPRFPRVVCRLLAERCGHPVTAVAARRKPQVGALSTEWVCPQCGATLSTPLPSREVFHTHGQGVTATVVYLIPKEDQQ
jgi:hypothetical protein